MNLKQALFSLNYTDTIGLSDLAFDTDPTTPSTVEGKFDPNLPAPDCFQFPSHTKGPLVGPEGVNKEAVKQAINNGALVGRLLQLLGPDYVVTDEDLEVVMHVKSKMGGPKPTLWNMDFLPLGKAADPVNPPAHPPVTPPVHPPVHPPTPKPPIEPHEPGTPRQVLLENFLSEMKRLVNQAAAVHVPAVGGGAPAHALRDLVHGAKEAIGVVSTQPN